MKVTNLMIALSPLLASALLTYFTYVDLITLWLAFGVWLSMVTGLFVFLNYAVVSRRAKRYFVNSVSSNPKFKIASFVTSFNEDPEIVKGTLISVKLATKDGEVFLLDDSTKAEIREELERFCRENNITYFHRENRRGFKGGAINDALKRIGDKFDLVAIFDADQRPLENFFEEVTPYFSDPRVAMVQIPQNYSETTSKISFGAKYQQEPFLRVIMRGRSNSSAFSLGSGSVFRISALKDIGYFAEYSITEDAATSILLNERGYITVYADVNLIWYGEPPQDLPSYLTQQSRWSFGYFQLFTKLLRSDLRASQFFDYFSGFLYWIKEGPGALLEFLSPAVFLIFKLPVVKINPILYIALYIPYMLITLVLFAYSVKDKGEGYGIKGFYYHQVVEYLAFFAITLSFLSWLARRRIPFKVTPKGGRGSRSFKPLIPHFLITSMLTVSLVLGSYWLAHSEGVLRYAIAVNVFWASYQIPFLLGGIAFSLARSEERDLYVEVQR
ncbi:MAG: cellulose synthase catalytic subunit [Metallosphaera sp.]|uniref:glycosyltransferase family 2 protein n=1 Tax=Metallosphaera sp. TaxID=2020860 RepID=UPI003166AFE0